MSRRSQGPRALYRGTLIAALVTGTTAGLIGSVAPSASAAGGGVVQVSPGAEPVPGSYIVVLNDSVSATSATSAASARSLTARYGGSVARTYSRVFEGFTVHTTEARARQLARDPAVAYVEQDTRVRVQAVQTGATWGLDRIDQRRLPLDRAYRYTTRAGNVHAYIIDTGITGHKDFGGRANAVYDGVGDGRRGYDCHGHGTHVAGTVGSATWGVAKGVKLHAVRVLDCQGSGSTSTVIAGIDWVSRYAQKPAVANLSLGGSASAALDNAVRNSIAKGVTYAVAAGNEAWSACSSSPARTAEAITVGATTRTDARASFSNSGSCVDIFAPGQDITSTSRSGGTRTMSGTSMAAPHAAGVAALFLARVPAATPRQVHNALVNAGTAGVVGNPGLGSPNKLLYTVFGATPAT